MPRTQVSVGPKTSLISKLRSLAAIHCKWIQDIGCARQEMIGEHSVDTVPGSVDTRSESLKQFHEDRVHCVDIVPGSVDTSRSLQKTQLPDWDSFLLLWLVWDCVGRVANAAVAPCVVSSSESECCELLYLSELRVVLSKFSGSVGGDMNFGVPGGGLGGRVITVGVWLPCKVRVCAAGGFQLLLCRVHGECGCSVCSCRGGVVGGGLTGSGLPSVEDNCRQVQARCSWSSSAHLGSASLLELSRCSVCRVASLVEGYDTCLWLLSALCWLVVSSDEVLPESFSVGSGGSFPELFVVVLVFPELCLGGYGGGSPKTGLSLTLSLCLRSGFVVNQVYGHFA
ncbi:hypothetical protein Taro_016423 [Colocasia esculenta]|uniref:Uncharacterized protein n=1 Tax=Colocasia esculenta TaxID=4460 RepID=A0A843UK94_COLES|nr:hypothetical protein [Colocasia esculenta]